MAEQTLSNMYLYLLFATVACSLLLSVANNSVSEWIKSHNYYQKKRIFHYELK